VTIDIDARKRVELALRDSEARLRTQALILKTMREGVGLVALDGRVEFTNPAFDRMFGRTSEELIGSSVLELFNNKQSQALASGWRRSWSCIIAAESARCCSGVATAVNSRAKCYPQKLN
jgi:PAS domain-containing protein